MLSLFNIALTIFINYDGVNELWVENTSFDENEEMTVFKIRKTISASRVEELTKRFHFDATVRQNYTMLSFRMWTFNRMNR